MPDDDGEIELCPHQGCGYKCCDFAANNFIAIYPGELEQARSSGQSVEHLSLVADSRGGYQAICRAKDTSSCDGGYKPLDCASYPFFPTVDDTSGHIHTGLKGEKCPLLGEHLVDHQRWVQKRWQSLVDTFPGLVDWIHQTRLVGYIPWVEDDAKGEELIQ